MYMEAGSAGELGRSRGLEQTGFWRKILEHPAYDAFWSQQAMDKILGAQPLQVPTMLVHGLWDQEDIYGAPAVYRAIEPKDTANDMVYFVAGPWYHGQRDRRRQRARRHPLRQRHREDVPSRRARAVPRAVLEGRRAEGRGRARYGLRDRHQHVAAPERVARRLRVRAAGSRRRRSTSAPGLTLGFEAPKAGAPAFDEYVSDPSKPVPYRPRPIGSTDSPEWADVAGERPARGIRPNRRARRSCRRC